MPKIVENRELRQHFIAKLQEKCAPIRTRIHVSDLTYCLRKAYWRRLKNKPLTEKQLQFFLDGHQRHQGLQGLVADFEHEVEVENFGVVGHIDLMSKHPIEIKTTRAKNNGQKPPHYLRQCAYYCLLTKTESCTLITQYINDGEFTFETIEFTPRELSRYFEEMIEARDKLQEAIDRQNPSALPFLENWQCRYCEFRPDCDSLPVGGV